MDLILPNLRDDALKRAVDGLSALITSAETIKLEEQNILRFSDHMIYVRDLLLKLRSQKARSALANFSPDSLCRLLNRMLTEVNNAREAIEVYKSKRRILRIMISPLVLSKLNQSSKEIAAVLQLLPFAQVNTALNIEAAVNAMICSLKSMELKQAAEAEAIRSILDMYISENTANRQFTEQFLVTIAQATGTATSSVFLNIEADDAQQILDLHNKPIYQFTEMLKPCTSNAETASSSARSSSARSSIDAEMLNFSGDLEAWSTEEIAIPPSPFFFCPLTYYKIMEDPVSVSCDHSFERRNIEKYFSDGHKCCPLCRKELSQNDNLLELAPNHTLLSSILEWKQRNAQCIAEKKAKMKLRDAANRIDLENMESTNRALEELQALFEEMPSCISEATTESSCKLVPKLAMLLKNGAANSSAVSKNLLCIARFSDGNKETIGRSGVIKCLLNLAKAEPNAIELLLELSKNMVVAQKIRENSSSVPILVSLLDNPISDVAEKVRTLLENLSKDIKFTIMMAKSGYFTPFLDQFNTCGNSEQTRDFMAEELAQMKLTDTAASKLETELFISGLTVMLSSSLTSSRLASMKCIKRLLGFNGLRTLLLNESTISALLCLVTDAATEEQHKQEAVEVLVSMVEVSQPLEQQINPSSLKLYSCNSIQIMLEEMQNSTPEGQVALLRLLLLIVQKSDKVRDWIISDHKAMDCLFPAITEQNSIVRVNAVKLISYIAGNRPMAIPFPPSPASKPILSSIITMLTTSSIVEERSAAANIISHLPPGDKSMDEMLQSSGLLTALHNLISQARKSDELLENTLGALLRCLNHSSSELQMQVSKLEPSLVQFLSTASPLVKQRAATILAYLARCANDSSPTANRSFFTWPIEKMRWPMKEAGLCSVHGTSCSLQRVICLVKAKAVKPLIDMMDIKEPDVSEAALTALDTLFDSGCEFKAAVDAIVESHGAAQILEVLEWGTTLPVKEKAFELFRKIYMNPGITSNEMDKFKGILLYLVDKEGGLKNKVNIFLPEFFRNTSPS